MRADVADRVDGPAWLIVDAGHTPVGAPWLVVRVRGGRMVRVTVAARQATPAGILEAVEHAVASLPPVPGPDCY